MAGKDEQPGERINWIGVAIVMTLVGLMFSTLLVGSPK